MGREIRMVPPNWEHPHQEEWPERLQPMYDRTFTAAAAEWKESFRKWEAGEDEDRTTNLNDDGTQMEYWEWNGSPPDRAYYRSYSDEHATWFQLWETVSEGTPVSPPFATKPELAEYLAVNGDFWDQKRGNGGWGMKSATAFCNVGWAPTGMVANGKWIDAKDIPASTE